MSADSPVPPSFDDREEQTLSGVEDLPRPMKKWAEGQAQRVRKIEKHFEDGGMVRSLHDDWGAVKKFFAVFKWAAPMIGSLALAMIVGVLWLINHAASQTPPPSAQDIARELAKQQSQQK